MTCWESIDWPACTARACSWPSSPSSSSTPTSNTFQEPRWPFSLTAPWQACIRSQEWSWKSIYERECWIAITEKAAHDNKESEVIKCTYQSYDTLVGTAEVKDMKICNEVYPDKVYNGMKKKSKKWKWCNLPYSHYSAKAKGSNWRANSSPKRLESETMAYVIFLPPAQYCGEEVLSQKFGIISISPFIPI